MLSKSGISHAAISIAKFGRVLTAREIEIKNFYGLMSVRKMTQKGGASKPLTPEVEQGLDNAIAALGKRISARFLTALENYDADEILKIAESVVFFRKTMQPDYLPEDRERFELLLMKHQLDTKGAKMTLRAVAEKLAGRKLETPVDGWSALRRKCKDLDFPLASSVRKRGKK